ncbi:MAG: transposase, partial [Burkholderiales bacterium]
MSGKRYTEEFKIEAVKQVTERGYSTANVAARLGISIHSLYAWESGMGVLRLSANSAITCDRSVVSIHARARRHARPASPVLILARSLVSIHARARR